MLAEWMPMGIDIPSRNCRTGGVASTPRLARNRSLRVTHATCPMGEWLAASVLERPNVGRCRAAGFPAIGGATGSGRYPVLGVVCPLILNPRQAVETPAVAVTALLLVVRVAFESFENVERVAEAGIGCGDGGEN